MHINNLFTLALAASTSISVSAIAIAGSSISSDTMLADEFTNSVTCGQKNPAINMVIEDYCNRDDLTVGTPFARGGINHNGIKVNVIGPNCPANSKWIPHKWCTAQFHHLCANVAGPEGQGWMRFGANQCQTWTIQKI